MRIGIEPAWTIQATAMPGDIKQIARVHLAGKEVIALQVAMVLAQGYYPSKEAQQIMVLVHKGPIEPAQFVILAVWVIVALLCAPDLIASYKHGHALRDHQDRSEIFDLTLAQRLDPGIIRFAFDTTIPAQVIINAIAVGFAVGLIMLRVVGNQVIKRKAVMRGHEIDAIDGQFTAGLEDVGAASDHIGHTPHHRFAIDVAFVSPNELPD